MKSRERGFTLIELLVVIAVIGILAAVILASLGSARGKARDAKRLADLKQIQIALQLYYTDYGVYPYTGGWRGTCSAFGSFSTTGSEGYIPSLAPTYISVLPVDPKPIGTGGCYLYYSDQTDYFLMAYTTVEGTVPDILKRPAAPTEKNYAFYTPGAVWW